MGRYKVNYKLWVWGRLQWGHDLRFLTKEAEDELEQIKKDNPEINFEKLAMEVKAGKIKPI